MQTTYPDSSLSPYGINNGTTLTAPKMPVPKIKPPEKASSEDWNMQFAFLRRLTDLRSTLIKAHPTLKEPHPTLKDSHPGLVILNDLVKMQFNKFKCWYFERPSNVVDNQVDSLILYSRLFNNLYVDINGTLLEDMGLDTIMASIFKSIERDLRELRRDLREVRRDSREHARKSTERGVLKQGIEGHRNWIERLPSSCPQAKKALDDLFGEVDK